MAYHLRYNNASKILNDNDVSADTGRFIPSGVLVMSSSSRRAGARCAACRDYAGVWPDAYSDAESADFLRYSDLQAVHPANCSPRRDNRGSSHELKGTWPPGSIPDGVFSLDASIQLREGLPVATPISLLCSGFATASIWSAGFSLMVLRLGEPARAVTWPVYVARIRMLNLLAVPAWWRLPMRCLSLSRQRVGCPRGHRRHSHLAIERWGDDCALLTR